MLQVGSGLERHSCGSGDLYSVWCYRLGVDLKATAVEVVTYTVNLEEAACGIAVTLPDLHFSISVLLNLPAPRPILPGYSAYSINRRGSL